MKVEARVGGHGERQKKAKAWTLKCWSGDGCEVPAMDCGLLWLPVTGGGEPSWTLRAPGRELWAYHPGTPPGYRLAPDDKATNPTPRIRTHTARLTWGVLIKGSRSDTLPSRPRQGTQGRTEQEFYGQLKERIGIVLVMAESCGWLLCCLCNVSCFGGGW